MISLNISFPKIFFPLIFAYLLFLLSSCKNDKSGNDQVNVLNDTSQQVTDALFKKYKLDKIKMPEGFKIEVYAEAPGARSLCLSNNGTVFVGTRNEKVFAITDKNHDGKADHVYEIASGLSSPNGVAFKDGALYIGASSTIYKMDEVESHLGAPQKPVVIYNKYPSDSHHGLRYIGFGPEGKLYVAVGAPCNVCEPSKPVYGTITRINTDGTGFEIFASGVRNTVGFDWDPSTKQIWFTDNGRDNLGDDIPNDELNTAPQAGMSFGFPYCHQGNMLDPSLGKGKNCSDYTSPVKLLGAHVAALGMRFNTENSFPSEYKNAIFIAEHGSWNRSIPIGYRISVVKPKNDGKLGTPEVFASGWLQDEKTVNGRPVDVQFLNDGSMLMSDDYNGVIYRISYKK
ncbi:MAG: PQQ-dependent sugar dehydrogenase [Ginsengibacter sp.]